MKTLDVSNDELVKWFVVEVNKLVKGIVDIELKDFQNLQYSEAFSDLCRYSMLKRPWRIRVAEQDGKVKSIRLMYDELDILLGIEGDGKKYIHVYRPELLNMLRAKLNMPDDLGGLLEL